jgi:hypothetical protein
MKPQKFSIVAALVLVLALAVAGCGGGGDDSSAAPEETAAEAKPTLSKEELIARGDAICGEVNAAVGAIGSKAEAEVQETTVEVAGLYVGMVQSLMALGRPTDPSGYAEFSAAAEELAKVEGEIKLAAERADTAALGEAATAAAPALEEFQSQAAIYGFAECSEGPSAPPITGESGGEAEAEGGVEEGGVEAAPEGEEEFVPEEEVAPEEEFVPEGGGAGVGEEAAPEGGGEEGSSGGVGPS